MKCKKLIETIVLGILTSMPSTVYGREKTDSLILHRIYEYHQQHQAVRDSLNDNLYLKLRYNVERRNPTLWLIPSMYPLAKGDREHIRESYSQLTYRDDHNFDVGSQVTSSTIRHDRRAIYPLIGMLTPNLYDAMLYHGHILSPFNRYNRRYYRYSQRNLADGTTRLDFSPKVYNTQLLNGYAIVDTSTGRILRTILNGEFDMITFRTEVYDGESNENDLIPERCSTSATFRFAGNRISSHFDVTYQNPTTLPDTLGRVSSRAMMDSIRPLPLSNADIRLYETYDKAHKVEPVVERDTTPKRENLLKKIFWDTIGDNLVTPIAAESGPASLRLSPIISPLNIRWSHGSGFSYKMKLRTRYTFSPHRYLTFNPNFGYNFKYREFYYNAPVRMTYNPKRNGYAEVIIGNANRISNSDVARVINEAHGDTIDFSNTDIDKYSDNFVRVFNNVMAFEWLDIESGFVYHRRTALNRELMRHYGMPVEYRSFAPMIGLKITPWQQGPVFSIDWEKGYTGEGKANIDYERWELDAQWKVVFQKTKLFNFRLGSGFYTRKEQNIFVDYANFRDNNLPGGWEDEWSGEFELLESRLYNVSSYYVRYNFSYDSPMMIATRIPYVGKYIERERFYLSTVQLQRSRPYFELGYSFTNRYMSVGMFAGFRNAEFQKIGFDFEFELFKRW